MNPTPRRALLVIDVQNEYVTGQLPIEYPPVEQSLHNVGRAMDAAQAAGIPVVVVQHSAPAGAPIFDPGADGWQLHPVVAARPRDHLVEKHQTSAFAGTDLEAWLRERGIETVTVAGYMTHNCVDGAVKHALQLGLAAEVLSDATGSLPYANRAGTSSARQTHEAFMVVLQSNFANVMTTRQWTDALQGAPLPQPGSIVASNRAAREAVTAA